jgi:hypothetical protein
MIAAGQNSVLPRQIVEQDQTLLVSPDPSHLVAVVGHYSAPPTQVGTAEQNQMDSILPTAGTADPRQLVVAVDPKDSLVADSRHCWLPCLPDSMVPVGPALHSRLP